MRVTLYFEVGPVMHRQPAVCVGRHAPLAHLYVPHAVGPFGIVDDPRLFRAQAHPGRLEREGWIQARRTHGINHRRIRHEIATG